VGQQVPVRVGDVNFYAEVADAGGPSPVDLTDALSFDGVRDTVEAIAGQIVGVWEKVRPSQAEVKFGLSLTAKTGKLTGLLVEGDGAASLTVTLTWKAPETH
jgi:hypothetical protein